MGTKLACLPCWPSRHSGSGERTGDGFRLLLDDGKQHARRAFRLALVLFPFTDSRDGKTESGGELVLTETELPPDAAHVDLGGRVNATGGGVSLAKGDRAALASG